MASLEGEKQSNNKAGEDWKADLASGRDGYFRNKNASTSGQEAKGPDSVKKELTVQSFMDKDAGDGKSVKSMKIEEEAVPKSTQQPEKVSKGDNDSKQQNRKKPNGKQKQISPRNPAGITKEKERDANAQWTSEWEQRKESSMGGGKVGNTQRDANKYWEGTLAKRLDKGDTRMYIASSKGSNMPQKAQSIDGLHQIGRKPKNKLGECKQREASERKIGDFYNMHEEKVSIKNLTKREVSQGVIGDFYSPRVEDDFMTRLENESISRRQSRQNSGNQKSRLNSTEDTQRRNNESDEPYWLVLDLETNKGFKVKKASSPQSAMRPDRSSNLSSAESFRSSVHDESRWDMSASPQKSALPQSRWPWDKSADSRTRGKNHDDLFRKDKENVVKLGSRNTKTKAPWETPDINQVQQTFKKDPNDIFRKDPALKEKNIHLEDNGPSKVLAPWETPFGKSANDLDVLFGKPAYGKSRPLQGNASKSFDDGFKIDTMPARQRTKAEEYHRELHRGNPGYQSTGF